MPAEPRPSEPRSARRITSRPSRILEVRDGLAAEPVIIAGYQVLQLLGKDELGSIYRALRLPMRSEVALKILHPHLAGSGTITERFLAQGRAAQTVRHANVIACLDASAVDGGIYQAWELWSGESLEALLRRSGGALPEKRALAIALDGAQGLEGIHQQGLRHGDVRAANLIVASDGTTKLGEPAFVRLSPESGPAEMLAAFAASRGAIAPELLLGGHEPDIRADIHALGATLYYAVTGAAPYAPTTTAELQHALLREPPPDPCAIIASLSSDLVAVIHKAMAKSPDQRYAHPSQLREDLERIIYDFSPIHAHSGPLWDRGGTASSHELLAVRQPPPPPADIPGTDKHGQRYAANRAPDSPPPAVAAVKHPHIIPAAAAALTLAVLVAIAVATRGHPGAPAQTVPAQAATAAPVMPTSVSPAPPAPPPATVVPSPPSAPALERPGWASAAGEDQYGRWADLAVADVVQRMRWCAPTTFWMGSGGDEPGRRDDEKRVLVTLSKGYWLADSETTQALYQLVTGDNPSQFRGPALPVEMVSWEQAQDFLRRLNQRRPGLDARLPSEAEWENACRAGGIQAFAGSSDPGHLCWSNASSGGTTHPVKSLQANAWGFFDLHGNVLEWCQDTYGPLSSEAVSDPHASGGIYRVARGGAWSMDVLHCRAAARSKYQPHVRFFFLGLRLAADG